MFRRTFEFSKQQEQIKSQPEAWLLGGSPPRYDADMERTWCRRWKIWTTTGYTRTIFRASQRYRTVKNMDLLPTARGCAWNKEKGQQSDHTFEISCCCWGE